jgi:uncharacterized membrane protein (UPF0127 family)
MVNNTLGYDFDAIQFESGSIVEAEISQTVAQLQKGLMYREALEESSGMLFVFSLEERHGFWMKNMNFPLDIIWIDSNLKIVDIARHLLPCSNEPCPVHAPAYSAKYVLELPAGFTHENNIQIGQGIVLEQYNLSQ